MDKQRDVESKKFLKLKFEFFGLTFFPFKSLYLEIIQGNQADRQAIMRSDQHVNVSMVLLLIQVCWQELVVCSLVCSKKECLVSNHIGFLIFVILVLYYYHAKIIWDLKVHGYVEERQIIWLMIFWKNGAKHSCYFILRTGCV